MSQTTNNINNNPNNNPNNNDNIQPTTPPTPTTPTNIQNKNNDISESSIIVNGIKIKKVGTREMVYKGLALKTAGNLTKDDIDLKIINGKECYISKKISHRMKELIKTSAIFKKPKKTHANKRNMLITNNNNDISNPNNNTANNANANNANANNANANNANNTTDNQTLQSNISHSINKTIKNISFLQDQNNIRKVFYEDLMDQDIEQLRIEANADDTMQPPKPFVVENIDNADLDISELV